MRPNAELSGRRRAQPDGNRTAATLLGAPLERRVGLCSKALTLAYRQLHERTWLTGDHDRTACVTVMPDCTKMKEE